MFRRKCSVIQHSISFSCNLELDRLDTYVSLAMLLYLKNVTSLWRPTAGDGRIDVEEYEYVLTDFGVPPRESRNAFTIFSQVYVFRVLKGLARCNAFAKSTAALQGYLNGIASQCMT